MRKNYYLKHNKIKISKDSLKFYYFNSTCYAIQYILNNTLYIKSYQK